MTTVKFEKAVKYNGIRYSAHEAFQVKDEDVEELKRVGAIILSVTPPADSPEQGDQQDAEPEDAEDEEVDSDEDEEETEDVVDLTKLKEDLLGYTVPELTQFAEDNDIDLQGKTRKADIYNVIVASLQ